MLTGGLRLQFRATEKHFAGAGWEKKKIPLRLQPSQKASLELWVCGPAPTLHCLGQSQAGGSSRPGAQAELPALGKLHRSFPDRGGLGAGSLW